MVMTSSARTAPRPLRRTRRGPLLPLLAGGVVACATIALVAHLLWPTWQRARPGEPERIPVMIGGTLFNAPTAAFRVKVQRHAGTQDRIDLGFAYPSLDAAATATRAADHADDNANPTDRIFVSIAAHHDALAPEARLRTIYPRYLDAAASIAADGLQRRAFREISPYAGEDLFASVGAFAARCTRDGITPGMCLSERRIEGVDVTFRFPRAWVADWRALSAAIETLVVQLHGGRN